MDVDVLKVEILEFVADIPKTSPARFNHPYHFALSIISDYVNITSAEQEESLSVDMT